MELPLFTLITFVLVVIGRSETDICDGKKCPKYKEVETNKDFQVRRYDPTNWITTKVDNNDVKAAYGRLNDYCVRQKEAGHDMGCDDNWPVLITVTDGSKYNMSWFVPGLLPEDTDRTVTLEQRPEATVYIKPFGGIPCKELGERNAEILREDLIKAGKSFESHNYTGASYDPFVSLTHRNEIWMYESN